MNKEEMDRAINSYWKQRAENLYKSYRIIGEDCPIQLRSDIEFPLFRYSKKRWIDNFFNDGLIRLTPLLAYRQAEKYNKAIGDSQEGQVNFLITGSGYFDAPVMLPILIQNQLTLCLTEERNDDIMMREFEAESCFQIDSVGFFIAINEAISEHCSSCLIERIVYLPDEEDWVELASLGDNAPLFAGCYKKQRHAYQREVRPMWEVKGYVRQRPMFDTEEVDDLEREQRIRVEIDREIQRLSPIDLVVPKAVKYCTRLF